MNLTPAHIAVFCALAGASLAVAGVFVLAGSGWALIAGGAALQALAAVVFRGLEK